ncbi:hypothetical protein TNCT_72051 [Trichonephila clavata]|uniref:Uncharacterized protein n=1 Tax=Trichonephila clavata TaxID=2740835 RepID=A0A8X6K942_TRICU|nr:hypothetical protein TNCT_72051 [Trichonephila clavata]
MEQTKAMEMNTKDGSNTPVSVNQGNTSNELPIQLSQPRIVISEDFVMDNEAAIRSLLTLPGTYDRLHFECLTTSKDSDDYALINSEFDKVCSELNAAEAKLKGIPMFHLLPLSIESLDEVVTRVKARRNAVTTASYATPTKLNNSRSLSNKDGFKVLTRKLMDRPIGKKIPFSSASVHNQTNSAYC